MEVAIKSQKPCTWGQCLFKYSFRTTVDVNSPYKICSNCTAKLILNKCTKCDDYAMVLINPNEKTIIFKKLCQDHLFVETEAEANDLSKSEKMSKALNIQRLPVYISGHERERSPPRRIERICHISDFPICDYPRCMMGMPIIDRYNLWKPKLKTQYENTPVPFTLVLCCSCMEMVMSNWKVVDEYFSSETCSHADCKYKRKIYFSPSESKYGSLIIGNYCQFHIIKDPFKFKKSFIDLVQEYEEYIPQIVNPKMMPRYVHASDATRITKEMLVHLRTRITDMLNE